VTLTVKELEEHILHHRKKYYSGSAEISDQEFDSLEETLRDLSPGSPVLQSVGASPKDTEKVKHNQPMLSLQKTKDPEEVVRWAAGEELLLSDKVDGSAASLIYTDGEFSLAKTRGDGIYGENTTSSMQHVSFPKQISPEIEEVRGEVCILTQDFLKLQEEMSRRGLQPPKSIRNCVAGLLHRKTETDLCKYLTFLAYGMESEEWYTCEDDLFTVLESNGFSLPRTQWVSKDIKESIQKFRDEPVEYLTDGLVFSIMYLSNQTARGFTSHHPKGKMAFKFPADVVTSTVTNILLDVGRTGKISFVAEIDPVQVPGATLSKCTLHNWKYVKDNSVAPGAVIELIRSNDVIPKHVSTIQPATAEKPAGCPVCSSELSLSDTGVDLYCTNLKCPARAAGRVENWVKVIGIDNLGTELLKNLYESEKVQSIPDLYRLKVTDLMEMPRMGKRSAEKVFKNIQKSKEVPFDKFLAGLGIEGLGVSTAKTIGEHFLSMDSFYRIFDQGIPTLTLSGLSDIGDITAENIADGMLEFGLETLVAIRQAGVVITDVEDPKDCTLAGKVFVITGSLSRGRKVVADMIKKKGGKVSSSISGKTDYLVCNSASGSKKCRDAGELGVPVIKEEKLYKLMEGGKK